MQHLETEGLAKMEAAVTGSEAEGLYGLLRRTVMHSSLSTSSPPPKKFCHAPYSFIPHLHPQKFKEPEASGPAGQTLESTSLTSPLVSEGEIPANMQPLHIQLGVSRGFIDVRLRVAGRDHKPPKLPFVHTYAKCTWEWGWCVPSATNLSSTLTPSDAIRRVT